MARLIEHVKHTDLSLSHHVAFWNAVEDALPPASLAPDGALGSIWKAAVKPKPPAPTNPLRVPYYSQRDSGTQHAHRMCFSSSCAMLLETLKPGMLAGANGDDIYLGRVFKYGDTTDSQAQIKALASFGIKAKFTTTGNFGLIEKQIKAGIPVPCGFLHKGPVGHPVGGGHWLCAIGFNRTAIIVNDPYGDLDLVNGTYLSSKGAGLSYSRKNFGPRWMADGANTGWCIIAERP
jgi:hypothetical protein